MSRHEDLLAMLAERRVGFRVDETMTGWHEFEPGKGDVGRQPMEFRVTWGPQHLASFLNPLGPGFMTNDMAGHVDIGGLCEAAPVEGTLELRYFTEAKLRYAFTFSVDGTDYEYVGEKIDLRPWNLHRTHTTCYGKLRERASGELVSRSITYFRLRTAPAFLASVRLG